VSTLRIAALNLNHRTRVREIPALLAAALLEHEPDVLVLTEYVDGDGRRAFRAELAAGGLDHVAVSKAVHYAAATYYNQVLIASSAPIRSHPPPPGEPYTGLATNRLTVDTHGLTITGFRMPTGGTADAALRDASWRWTLDGLRGDVLIGDFNIDPNRRRTADQRPVALLADRGWRQATVEGGWSYQGARGQRSCLDHVCVRGELNVIGARYVHEPFVSTITDHALLVADLEVRARQRTDTKRREFD
jgi:hypothetical protein